MSIAEEFDTMQAPTLDDGPKKKPVVKPDTIAMKAKRDASLRAVMDEGPPPPGTGNVERIKHYNSHVSEIALLNALIGAQRKP